MNTCTFAQALHPGARLNLKAEPGNLYDFFAVEMLLGDIKLGYVPRHENKHIFRLLKQRAELECVTIEVNAHTPPWNAVKVEVALIA